ncbi:MAG: hypothetical protein MRJ67_14515 [Nitrospirales bacterium]|nr:hypothetical protein [Nitrospirales bacterium]MDR4482167.1 hypothetical protein [Nitrospirales bacterium]
MQQDPSAPEQFRWAVGCLQRVLFFFRIAGIFVVSAENRVEMMILFCLKAFMAYLLLLSLKIAAVGLQPPL